MVSYLSAYMILNIAKWFCATAALNSVKLVALFMAYHCCKAPASIKAGKRIEKYFPSGVTAVGP